MEIGTIQNQKACLLTAVAESAVEVMHVWTTGGEAAALNAVRADVVALLVDQISITR